MPAASSPSLSILPLPTAKPASQTRHLPSLAVARMPPSVKIPLATTGTPWLPLVASLFSLWNREHRRDDDRRCSLFLWRCDAVFVRCCCFSAVGLRAPAEVSAVEIANFWSLERGWFPSLVRRFKTW